VGNLAVFTGAIRRLLAADFPRFVLLLGFACVQSMALLLVNFLFSFKVYFYSFYSSIAIESVLLVLVAAEIFRIVFEPVSALPANAISRMAGAVIGTAAMVVAVVIWARPFGGLGPAYPSLYGIRMAVETVICCSFWLLALYSRIMGFRWRSRVADILSGFLFYMTIHTITHALVWLAPHSYAAVLSRIETVAYLGALCFWFAALRFQAPTFQSATQARLLMLKAYIEKMYSTVDRQEALGVQEELSLAFPPPGPRPRPRTFDELIKVLRAVVFFEFEPISYRQMLELRRGILYNCAWLLCFVRDQHQPLAVEMDKLGEVETLKEDVLRVMFECFKVYFGFSRKARLRRMQRLAKLYDEVRLAAMLLCIGAQSYLVDDIALAL